MNGLALWAIVTALGFLFVGVPFLAALDRGRGR